MLPLFNILLVYFIFSFENFVCSSRFNRLEIKKQPSELNITNKKTNDKYIYYNLGGLEVYSPTGVNVFNEVKDGDDLIWKSSNEKEYSTRVEIDGKKLSIKCPNVLWLYSKEDDGTWKFSEDIEKEKTKNKVSSPNPSSEPVVPVKDLDVTNKNLKQKVAKLEKELLELKQEYDQFRSKVLSVDNSIDKVVEFLGGL